MSQRENRNVNRKRSKHLDKTLKKAFAVSNDEELRYLEKAVLGIGDEIFKDSSSDSDEERLPKIRKDSVSEEKKPVWVDEDDDHTYNEILKAKHRKEKCDLNGVKKFQNVMEKKFKEIMGVPKWAQQTKKSTNPVDNILNMCEDFIKKPKSLNKDIIRTSKLKNLNYETNSEGPIISVVKFHRKSMVAMVAGSSGIVSLFQVDGKENTKLQSLQFQKYPIFCGSFLKNGEEFIIGSKFYRYFYCHSLMTGKSIKVDASKLTEMTRTTKFCVSPKDDFFAVCGSSGKIYLFTVSTKEYVDTLQMNCMVKALSFNADGSVLYSHGEDGEVYVWDMNSRVCMRKFFDDGCLTGTSIASSFNDQFLACGSSSGVVNVYDSQSMDSLRSDLPMKSFYNLRTPVTSLRFNSTSEILAMASHHKEAAIKLIHCPSMTVFSNFPVFQTKIQKPSCIDFSVNSGFMAVGDSNGAAHLFRLKNYENY